MLDGLPERIDGGVAKPRSELEQRIVRIDGVL
jgi:hypothetical protein